MSRCYTFDEIYKMNVSELREAILKEFPYLPKLLTDFGLQFEDVKLSESLHSGIIHLTTDTFHVRSSTGEVFTLKVEWMEDGYETTIV